MTERAIQAVDLTQRFTGNTFVFAGKFRWNFKESAISIIEASGGTVVENVTSAATYLIVGESRGTPAAQKEAEKLNKSGSAIQIIDDDTLMKLCDLSGDELLQAIKDPQTTKLARLCLQIHWGETAVYDFSGKDLRGLKIDGATYLACINFDGANLSEASLTHVGLAPNPKGTIFDRALIRQSGPTGATNCSFKNTRLQTSHFGGGHFIGCDFDGAKIESIGGYNNRFKDCNFKGAELKDVNFHGATFENCDMSNVDLSETHFQHTSFKSTKFIGANLSNAQFPECTFHDCNLKGANMKNSVFIDADFTKADISGADFTNANVASIKVNQSDVAKAKGLKEALDGCSKTEAGPKVQALEAILDDSEQIDVSIQVEWNGALYLLQTRCYSPSKYRHALVSGWATKLGDSPRVGVFSANAKSLSAVMLQLAGRLKGARLDFESLSAKGSKMQVTPKEAKAAALGAWCEVFGVDVPDEKTLKEAKSNQKAAQDQIRETLVAELRGGMSGIKSWNARSISDKQKAGTFRRIDLANQHLCDAQLDRLDFEGAVFDGANLSYAVLDNSDVKKASFKGACLEKTQMGVVSASEADFTGAKMNGAVLRGGGFLRAIFANSDLTAADFSYARLQGADLSTAIMTNASVNGAEFDEHTKMPPDFVATDMKWRGAGPDPLQLKQVMESAPAQALDFEAFVERLQKSIDAERLKKSLKMLKAESFQLFAEVTDESVIGVVKSQTDPDLVYSARLASNGVFACCTQNLNPCGGLRGALCKHLLVLIVGLTKAGELDANIADAWARASKIQKPVLDKDIMSETFLRYKGAEAGEIDWRPTETIPEDYYAF